MKLGGNYACPCRRRKKVAVLLHRWESDPRWPHVERCLTIGMTRGRLYRGRWDAIRRALDSSSGCLSIAWKEHLATDAGTLMRSFCVPRRTFPKDLSSVYLSCKTKCRSRGAKAASTMKSRHKRKAAAKVRVENNELHASGREPRETESLFAAEAAYADSIFRTALGDSQGCIDALGCSLEFMPTYAPALLSLGTAEYQLGHRAKGWNLFMKLFALPDDTRDL